MYLTSLLALVVRIIIIIFLRFIYLTEREYKQGEQQAEGEAGSPPSKEPDAGLDPRTLRS